MKRRIFVLVLILATCLTIFGGCAGKDKETKDPTGTNTPDVTAETIKVGVLAPLTGDVAVYGTAVKNAVELYVDKFNAEGGVNGASIQLVVLDEKGDPTEAVNAYNKLVNDDEVVAIIGDVTSTPTFAVAQASVDDNIPMLTPTATHPDVTSYGKNMFRACFQDPDQSSTMAKLAYEDLGAKTAAVIYNSSDAYSVGLKDAFVETANELGLEIVATEAYGKDDVAFQAQLTNIGSANPDVLFIPDYYNPCYMIARQAKDMGITATLLGVDGTDGVLTIEGADTSVLDGIYFSNHYFVGDSAEIVQNFVNDFKNNYNEEPNALAALGYDAAMIMCAAIKSVADSGTKIDNSAECRQAIIDAISETDMTTVTGHLTFDENNNTVKELSIINIVHTDGEAAYDLYGKISAN